MEEQNDTSKIKPTTKYSNVAMSNKYLNTFTDVVVGQQSEFSLIIKEVLFFLKIVVKKLLKWINRYKNEIIIICFVLIVFFGFCIMIYVAYNQTKEYPTQEVPIQIQASQIIKPSATPTNIPLPTIVPFTGLSGCVSINQLSVRSGPGIEYTITSYLYEGNCLFIYGRSIDSNWLLIVDVNSANREWVSKKFISLDGDFLFLPVIKEEQITSTP